MKNYSNSANSLLAVCLVTALVSGCSGSGIKAAPTTESCEDIQKRLDRLKDFPSRAVAGYQQYQTKCPDLNFRHYSSARSGP